jgi:hypothetical protein
MKLRVISILLLLLAAVSETGCKKHAVLGDNQHILFQVEYINYAWGYQHSGILIDNEGKVWTYNNPENWNFADDQMNIAENLLEQNLSACKATGIVISKEDLDKFSAFIPNIASSKVTALKNIAADAGSTSYICYRHSQSTSSYKGAIIKMEGDFSCENLNFFSKKTVIWLKDVRSQLIAK